MREIKFRLWNCIKTNPSLSRMFYDVNEVMECLKQQLSYNYNNKKGYNHIEDGSAFMQFTGLYDKNGKEIYEGDILFSESWGSSGRSINKYHVVKWKECEWIAAGYNGTIPVSPSLTVRKDFEIIGNIYENPELLTN